MAIVHRATLTPSKQELVESWLPSRPWADGRSVAEKVAEYRFDDPAGEVGVETIVWRTDDGSLVQTPLTYRAAPLEGADAFLIGTAEHSVLGPRWVYDGCADPIWATTLAAAIVTGGSQAQMYLEQDSEQVEVPARMQVRGSGSAGADVPAVDAVESVRDEGPVTRVAAGPFEVVLARVVGSPVAGNQTLSGRIGDQELGPLVGLRLT
ncbi:MAG: hypothetical protein J2P22_17520 [Nocardioides sp.]|nr:hypothetical protein [Nocardioides sp.]